MWEDILKLRQYELGDERRSSGKVAFNALRKIRQDLIDICKVMSIPLFINSDYYEYYAKYDSDYYRMLERLNSIIYEMSEKPELDSLSRKHDRLENYHGRRRIFTRRVSVQFGKKNIRLSLNSRESTKNPHYNVNMNLSISNKNFDNERLKLLREELIKYFTNNFDNGNLDVISLVNNIFNHLDLTIVEEGEELEGTIREKWWQ